MPHHANIVRRATTAFYRTAVHRGETSPPPITASWQVEHAGLRYLILSNDTGVLAVYRVRPDGKLKRLRQWPQELEAEVIQG